MRTTMRWPAVLACALLAGGCGDDAEPEGAPLPADASTIVAASAQAMGEVTSVRFDLNRSGADVYIDEFESLALDKVAGRFSAPSSAEAVLTLTVNGSLTTQLGAVALDGDAWMSNPVTGDFEELPPGYDVDPAAFFDPKGGWRPLLDELRDVVLIGEETRGGKRYHIRGTGPAARMELITAGLVRDQDVEVDLWVRRDTGLVTAAEFSTVFEGKTTHWVLELRDYGKSFTIEAPEING